MTAVPDTDRRVRILAAQRRDAQLAASALREAGIAATVCADIAAFCSELAAGAAVGLLTETALAQATRAQLVQTLSTQPPWSDFPLVVMAGAPPTTGIKLRLAEAVGDLGNVTLLERPMHPEVLVRAVRGALRARERQYQARGLLFRLEHGMRQRDQFLATLGHELRNPLGAIRNVTQVLARRLSADAENLRHLRVVDRQTAPLARLVDDLLDGFRVDVAESGPEGVRQALTLRPAAAVIDIGLPGIDGYEVARRVRAGLGAEITLVALTGYGQPDARNLAKQAGFDVSLVKPVDLRALEAILHRHLEPG